MLYVTHLAGTTDLSASPLFEISEAFKALGADEIDPDGPHGMRIWWD